MRHSDGLRAAVGGSAVNRDADFKNTALLLRGDGTNGAQNNAFIDGSTNNFTITRNGNTTQGTFSPFGDRWSNYFDGSGDSISAPSNAAFNLSSDFSIECWVYFNGSSPSGGGVSGELLGASSAGGAIICVRSGNLFALSTTATADDLTASFTFATGNWYHLVACRTGITACLFINGTRVATGTVTRNYSQSAFAVNSGLNGYISNLRVIKGSNLYGTGSTLSVPTSPLTAIANTSLLTCQSNRFIDNSTNNFTITLNGDVRVEKFNPFGRSAPYSSSTDGGSGYFDGNGDYLGIAANSAFGFGSGDFTMECWFYKTTSNLDVLLDTRINAGGSQFGLALYVQGNTLKAGNDAERISGGTVTNNSWNHCALVRSGNNISLYLNGSRTNTTAFSTTLASLASCWIGSSASSEFAGGYISNARAVKGTAVYTGTTYTIPTAPLTAISNTSLLLNFTNAGVIDNTGLNVLETVGNAQISTATKKFGTGSLFFDGSGDFIQNANDSTQIFVLGTQDFTIESWIYASVLGSSFRAIYDQRPVATVGNYPTLYVNDGVLYYFVNGANRITGPALSLNTWYHVAICRSGTNTRMFLNGVQQGSTYTDSTVYLSASGRPWIGQFSDSAFPTTTDAGNCWNGYIDDLRVTKGIARYTANFTPPTAPFPDF